MYGHAELDLCQVCIEKHGTSPAAIDGSTDEPAPEVDPPGRPGGMSIPTDLFSEMYPMARDHAGLWAELTDLLGAEQARLAANGAALPPQPGTTAFDAIAHWSRTVKAHKQGQERAQRGEGGVPGLYVPLQPPMPKELKALLAKPKKKRGARPLT